MRKKRPGEQRPAPIWLHADARGAIRKARRWEVLTRQTAAQQTGASTRGVTHTAHRQHQRIKSNARDCQEILHATKDTSIHFRRCLDRPSEDQAAWNCCCSFSLGGGGDRPKSTFIFRARVLQRVFDQFCCKTRSGSATTSFVRARPRGFATECCGSDHRREIANVSGIAKWKYG